MVNEVNYFTTCVNFRTETYVFKIPITLFVKPVVSTERKKKKFGVTFLFFIFLD